MRADAGRHGRVAVLAALVASLALWGCGGDEAPTEPTEFEAALASLGEGVSPTGTGFGWVDLDGLRGYPGDQSWAANALGPGGDDLVDDATPIFRGTGFDPSAASAGLAIASSYALGVRLEGVGPGRLPALLRAAGARSSRVRDWTLYDLGRPADGTTHGPLRPLGALVSRVAIGPERVVLTRFEAARDSLIAREGTLLSDRRSERLEVATDCLGEVVAARMILGSHSHNPIVAPDLIAIGVRPLDGERPTREVLCSIDGSADDAEERAAALESAFAPDATDPVTGRAIADLVADAAVSTDSTGEFHVARAELEPAAGAGPGILFGAFVSGSLLTYLGAERPVPRDAVQ